MRIAGLRTSGTAAALVGIAAPRFGALLRRIDAFAAALGAIGPDAPPQPRWNQDWFPRLDAAAAYAMVRDGAPRRIVEVGSGHSTRFMARAIADGGLATTLTSIDPAPRAPIAALPIERLACRVEAAGVAPFAALAEGDILFIDSSHRRAPGNDVAFLYEEVVPRLAAGALLHVHDVVLPDDYPADWAWRRYDEQALVAALIESGAFEVLWSSHYVATRLPDALARSAASRFPLVPGARESSLWLRKVTPRRRASRAR
jgi:predicted O-methyltransferase YrrM